MLEGGSLHLKHGRLDEEACRSFIFHKVELGEAVEAREFVLGVHLGFEA